MQVCVLDISDCFGFVCVFSVLLWHPRALIMHYYYLYIVSRSGLRESAKFLNCDVGFLDFRFPLAWKWLMQSVPAVLRG